MRTSSMNSDVVSVRLLLAVAAISARAAGQQLPPECVPSASGDGVGIIDAGQITYDAANMPYVADNRRMKKQEFTGRKRPIVVSA